MDCYMLDEKRCFPRYETGGVPSPAWVACSCQLSPHGRHDGAYLLLLSVLSTLAASRVLAFRWL